MVHAHNGAGEEEGDPGHDDISSSSHTAVLQLHPVERHEDRLQEVTGEDPAFFFNAVLLQNTLFVFCVRFLAGTDVSGRNI